MSRSLWWRHGLVVASCRIRGTECNSACMGPFEGDLHHLHYLHHSLSAVQITEREQSPALQQKIRLKICWAWPHPSEQDPVYPSVSLSHQEASISLLPSPSEGRQTENHSHRKLTNLITWTTHSLVLTQWNCEPCHVWSPKTDESWWRVLTKSGSLEKGMADHFSILALRTTWTVWKGKKIRRWKMNSPGR